MDQSQEKLKEISCAPECGFLVRSHDKEEVVSLAKQHVDQKHPGMKITREKLGEMAKNV